MGPTHEKLEKILPLINSSYEGEAHSAFLAIRRCLQSDGFELADVIRAGAQALASRQPVPATFGQHGPDPETAQRFNAAMDTLAGAFKARRTNAHPRNARSSRPPLRHIPVIQRPLTAIPDHIRNARITLIEHRETKANRPYIVVAIEHRLKGETHVYSPLMVWEALAAKIGTHLAKSRASVAFGHIAITRPDRNKPHLVPVVSGFEPAT